MLLIDAYPRYQAGMSLQNTSPAASVPPPPPLAEPIPYQRHPDHLRALRRIAERNPPDANATLTARCVTWLFPWPTRTYPGIGRGILSILSRHLTRRSLDNWRSGFRPLPAWAAKDLADHMQSLVDQALPLIAALRDLERAEEKRIKRIDRGFCVSRAARNRPAPGDPA